MNMENSAIFEITANKGTYQIKTTNRKYNLYNQYDVSRDCLFTAMNQLADVFNNVIGVGIYFVIG
jgi:hypothetical protein